MSFQRGGVGDLFRVRIETGDVDDLPTPGLWDTALWDTDVWGTGDVDTYLVDVTEYCEGFTTRMGRQRWVSRFRAGVAVVTLDNTFGTWTPSGGATLPGFLPLRPGRLLVIETSALGEWVPIFTGPIDTIGDSYNAEGDLSTRITGIDVLGWAATSQSVANLPAGGGESSSLRMRRIIDHAWPDPAVRPELRVWGESTVEGSGGVPMLDTTLADPVQHLMQITADSEGGGVWVDAAGRFTFALSDYFTDQATDPEGPDWALGAGITDIERTDWSAEDLINEAHIAHRGGNEEVVTNQESIDKYRGRRTHTRLDLEHQDDSHSLFLAQRLVTLRGNDRPRIVGITIAPDTTLEARLAVLAEPGDTILLTVATMHGWSYALKTQVSGVSHTVTPSRWETRFVVDDTNVQSAGAYSSAYSDAYDI